MADSAAALTSTRDRGERLLCDAVPSVLRQNARPPELVVVDDGRVLSAMTRSALSVLAEDRGVPLTLLRNERRKGAAGAWNTGLAHLAATERQGFVALLEDDDTWDDNHLEAHLAYAEGSIIVVSGQRLHTCGQIVLRPLISAL